VSATFVQLHLDSEAALHPEISTAWMPQVVAPCAPSRVRLYQELLAQLADFSRLGDNWDGYGGAPISREAIALVRSVLGAQMRNPGGLVFPEIVPTPNGTVALEWQEGGGEAVVEVGEERISGFVKLPSGVAVFLEGEGPRYGEIVATLVSACMQQEVSRTASINHVEFDSEANA